MKKYLLYFGLFFLISFFYFVGLGNELNIEKSNKFPLYFLQYNDGNTQPFESDSNDTKEGANAFNRPRYSYSCIPGISCPPYVNSPYRYIPPNYFWNSRYGWLPPYYYPRLPVNYIPNAYICRNGYYWCALVVAVPPGSLCRCYSAFMWFDGIAGY